MLLKLSLPNEACIDLSNYAFSWQDNNLGLVKQVLSSMYKRNIQRLTQTYLTLSLEDIARSVQLDTPRDAEMHVLRMVGVFSTSCLNEFHKRHIFTLLIPNDPDRRWRDPCNHKPEGWHGQLS
jgi:hypothetical protein